LVRDLTDALGPSIKVLLKNSDFQSEILGWEVPSLMEQLRGTAFWVQGMISLCSFHEGKLLQLPMVLCLVTCPISATLDGSQLFLSCQMHIFPVGLENEATLCSCQVRVVIEVCIS
jgi:hypothetical protein